MREELKNDHYLRMCPNKLAAEMCSETRRWQQHYDLLFKVSTIIT